MRSVDDLTGEAGRACRCRLDRELVDDRAKHTSGGGATDLAVLRYLPSQLSQREIASELYVSLNTVKTHCKSIYRKLGVDGRKPAVQAARDLDLL